ncbi:MAG: PKD domain-containing protein [Bacteroidales bacterium]|nr:PKD domain-containing protein [Bacteroidales bacterium]
MKKNKNIEDWFRTEFEGYRVTPSKSLWGRVLRKMRWIEFLQFSPTHLNIYYLAAILMVSAGIYFGVRMRLPDNNPRSPKTFLEQGKTSPVKSSEKNNIILPAKNSYEKQTEKPDSVGDTHKKGKENTISGGNRPEEKNPSDTGQAVKETEANQHAGDHNLANESQSGRKITETIGSDTKTTELSRETSSDEVRPHVAFRAVPEKGCPPLQVRFINQSENCERYIWTIGNKQMVFQNEKTNYIFEKPGIYIVSLAGANRQGQKDIFTDTITVFEAPKAEFEIYPRHATVPETEITFYNNSENATRYLWDFGDGHFSEEAEPVHHYSSEGPFSIVLKVWSPQGCMDTIMVKNAFENSMYFIRFPNAFIPNPNGPCDGYFTEAPGANEVFHPVWKGVSEYHLQIYNRRGELIFTSNELQRGWDGYILDKMAKADVYIWKAKGTFSNGKPFVRFGNVTLIKKKN